MWKEKFPKNKYEENNNISSNKEGNKEKKQDSKFEKKNFSKNPEKTKKHEKEKVIYWSYEKLNEIKKNIEKQEFSNNMEKTKSIIDKELNKLENNIILKNKYNKNQNLSKRPLEVQKEISKNSENLQSKLDNWDKNIVANKIYSRVKKLIDTEQN